VFTYEAQIILFALMQLGSFEREEPPYCGENIQSLNSINKQNEKNIVLFTNRSVITK
jgi:hypothetical protein